MALLIMKSNHQSTTELPYACLQMITMWITGVHLEHQFMWITILAVIGSLLNWIQDAAYFSFKNRNQLVQLTGYTCHRPMIFYYSNYVQEKTKSRK